MKTALNCAAIMVLIAGSPMCAAEKKLISFGSADPDTFWLPDHIAEMQATPFDGTVFYARGENASGDYFSWGAWGTRAYTHSGMQYAVDQLRATNFGSFNENFLRLNVTPGNVD